MPPEYWYYRFRDGTANYRGKTNENVRFQQSNIADCLISTDKMLFICELKSHKGKSLPFNCVRPNQIEQMQKAAKFNFICPLLIVFFANVERCFAVHIDDWAAYIENSEKKSANIQEFETFAYEIKAKKLQTHYRYDIAAALKEITGEII